MNGIIVTHTRSLLGFSVTTSTIDLLAAAVEVGLDYDRAATMAHLSKGQANKLRKDAGELVNDTLKAQAFTEDYKALLWYFVEAITTAQAKGELDALEKIKSAGSVDWKAADRWLQITRPERYSKRSFIYSEALPTTASKNVNFDEMSDEKLRELVSGSEIIDGEVQQTVEPNQQPILEINESIEELNNENVLPDSNN